MYVTESVNLSAYNIDQLNTNYRVNAYNTDQLNTNLLKYMFDCRC